MSERLNSQYSYEQPVVDATRFEDGDRIDANMSHLGSPEEGRRHAQEEAARLALEAAERPNVERRNEACVEQVTIIGRYVDAMRSHELALAGPK